MTDGFSDYSFTKTANATNLNSASLVGFPVFVRLEQTGDTTGTGAAGLDTNADIQDETDIGFFDENDNPLNYYFTNFDATNGIYEAWVSADITRDGSVQLKVGYGSGSTDDTSAESSVFDNVGDYNLEDRYDLQSVGDGTAEDSTSNNRDGTVNGATESSRAQFGSTSSDFDGSSSAIKLPGTVPGKGGGKFYFSCWAYLDSNNGPNGGTTRGNFFAKENSMLFSTEGSAGLYIRTYNDNNGGTGSAVSTGEWHHFVLAYDSGNSTSEIWLDGTKIETASVNPGDNTASNPKFFGARDGTDDGSADSEYLDGQMQEARFGSSIPSDEHTETSYDMSSAGGYTLLNWNQSNELAGNGVVMRKTRSDLKLRGELVEDSGNSQEMRLNIEDLELQDELNEENRDFEEGVSF